MSIDPIEEAFGAPRSEIVRELERRGVRMSAYDEDEPDVDRVVALQAEVVRLREALEGLNVGARHEFEWVEDARRPGVVNAVCKPDCAKCHAEALLAHERV